MDSFSWTDSLKAAVSPCLACMPCTDNNDDSDEQRNHSGRPDLQRLLADSGDTDTEAETLSLHSNLGDRRRKKKRGPIRQITLFGYHVFGKPSIRLEGDDDGLTRSSSSRDRNVSTSTLDSDAAPLDPSTIDELSAAQLQSQLAEEEEQRRQKEERRRRRRERKERERMSLALAMEREEEFEGFPGSATATYANVPVPYRAASHIQDFIPPGTPDIEEEGADFEAEMYNNPRSGAKSSRSDSDSRSRTSASMSNPDVYNHHYMSQQPGPIQPPKSRRSDASKKRRASSKTSSKTSQSSSLHSPTHQSFSPQPVVIEEDNMGFEGVPPEHTFPSSGLSGGNMRRQKSDMGVVLARRGDV